MEKKNPLTWLNLVVSESYYLLHFLAFFSYFVVRSSASQVLIVRFKRFWRSHTFPTFFRLASRKKTLLWESYGGGKGLGVDVGRCFLEGLS